MTEASLTDRADSDPAGGDLPRVAQAIGELLALHSQFEGKRAQDRSLLYAQCIFWLTEIKVHARPPLPIRDIIALTREVDWHLRSIAGLGSGKVNTPEEHAAWALDGLERLARCAGSN